MRKRSHTRVKLTETDLLRSFFLDFKVCIRKLPKDLCLGIDEIYNRLKHDSSKVKHIRCINKGRCITHVL